MDDEIIKQAEALEAMLPQMMRRLFSMDHDRPAAELPLAQLRVCTILQGGTRSISSMADELGTSLSAVTQLADRLEKAGMVERIPESDDRRSRKLQLTSRGALVMKSRRRERIERVVRALTQLPEATRRDVLLAVAALRSAAATARNMHSIEEAPHGVSSAQRVGREVASELLCSTAPE